MHKLALAATLTAVAAGGTIAIVTATRTTDAEASATHDGPASTATSTAAHAAQAPAGEASCRHHGAGSVPSLPALLRPHRERAVRSGTADCTAVGDHLAELQTQTGAGDDPARCAKDFTAICEHDAWSLERRACALAADDLMNAHLCAFTQQGSAQDSEVPPALACSAVATHVTPIIQGAGIYTDVADLAQQIEDACDAGAWSTDLRQCFAGAQAIDALHACLQ